MYIVTLETKRRQYLGLYGWTQWSFAARVFHRRRQALAEMMKARLGLTSDLAHKTKIVDVTKQWEGE